jgi:hypothetical protein
MSSTLDLKAGWRRGKQGGIYRPVDGGGGAAHRKWRRRGGGITSGTRGGEQYRHGALPMRALSGEKGERTGWVRSARGRASDTPARRETRERGSGTGTRVKNREPTQVLGKRGAYSARGEASAAPCRGQASTTHVGLATDGSRRTHSDSDPASVERSSGIGATSHRCSNYSRSLVAILSLSLFSLFSY